LEMRPRSQCPNMGVLASEVKSAFNFKRYRALWYFGSSEPVQTMCNLGRVRYGSQVLFGLPHVKKRPKKENGSPILRITHLTVRPHREEAASMALASSSDTRDIPSSPPTTHRAKPHTASGYCYSDWLHSRSYDLFLQPMAFMFCFLWQDFPAVLLFPSFGRTFRDEVSFRLRCSFP
jgi:hypothetical protein